MTAYGASGIAWATGLKFRVKLLSGSSGASVAQPAPKGWRLRERYAWILAGCCLIGALALGIALLREREPDRGTYRFSVLAPDADGPLYRVSDAGGTAVELTTLELSREESAHRWPQFLPDGKHFLYVARSANPDQTGIYLRSLDSEESTRLVGAYSSVAYLPPYLLYVRGQTLMAQPFDPARLALLGEPFPVAERVGSFTSLGKAQFSVSENGVLAYHKHMADHTLPVWFDREGKRLSALGSPAGYESPALSPDEKTLAIGRLDPQTGTPDIWLVELSHGATSRLTSHARTNCHVRVGGFRSADV